MKTHKNKKLVVLLFLAALVTGCAETYPLSTNTYEEAIVIEATLTNELKKQEIKISKTARFEDESVTTETGATVVVKDNMGNEFPFEENSELYISQSEFKALPNRIYTLEIKTVDGNIYQSSNESLTTETEIESIIPSVVVDNNEGRGVQISVNSYDPSNTSKYYRYEYEETYKIIAPKWKALKLIVTGPESVALEPNPNNTRTCYTTKKSTDIILTSTTDLLEDRINYQIRFISDQNYIIANRYSILVKQYVQNIQSYTFRKTLKELSSSSSILSPKQPGLINGNINCITDSNQKAIGFFEVSSVSSKRVFFNYSDLFPNEPNPPYISDCEEENYKFCFYTSIPDPCQGKNLINKINANTVSYLSNIDNSFYSIVPIECGDCTSFSSNKIPSFWTN